MSGIIAQNTLDNSGLIKSPAGGGAWNFISKLTASSSATLSFTSGIDSTYKEYLFTYNNIHPATDGTQLTVGFRDGSTAYDATKTSTMFATYHQEDDGESSGDRLAYQTSGDLAQGTGFQRLIQSVGNDNDQCVSGEMYLFDPSSTVFVKHYISVCSSTHDGDASQNFFVAGHCNVTAAIDGVQFKMSSGNIDAGDFCLYGLTT